MAAELTMRLRIAWGGGAEREWRGALHATDGKLTDLAALGVEADEPGSLWLEDGRLHIHQRSPRAYDAVDVLVTGDPHSRLMIALTPAGAADEAKPIDIPLAELVGGSHASALDQQGNRLLVSRSPGDRLRVAFDRQSLVFSPGETFDIEAQPHMLGLPAGAATRVAAQLSGPGGARGWSDDQEAVSDEAGAEGRPAKFSIKIPDSEGVYDVLFTASASWSRQLLFKKQLAERKVQLVVIDTRPPARASGFSWNLVAEIDPANPNWWERIGSVPSIPGLRKGPLGNSAAGRWDHPVLGPFMQLHPSGPAAQPNWEAYPLAVQQPGLPHQVEIEYPSDVAQTLGVSILEPNAAGAVVPIGLDSGVYVGGDESDGQPKRLKHSVIFWPRTRSPLLLVTNRRAGARAVYGSIRLLGPAGAGKFTLLPSPAPHAKQLPPKFPVEPRGGRLLAGYYDRPLVAENFSASESYDPVSRRSLDDWNTFYQAGSRLVDYLRYVGYNGLMLTVAADSSGIAPSKLLAPTPRHDTGVFFSSGQDPVRKDIAEMLFRLFDREGLRLIPAVQFTGPLPALEELRHREPEIVGLDWIGADGNPWVDRRHGRPGATPTYNPLDPRVQEAMVAVVAELAERYRGHPSFAGLAISLCDDGYAQLPSPDGGYDDETIARFTRDTRVEPPGAGSGPDRFAARAQYLNGSARSAWLAWRANQIAALHMRLRQAIGSTDGGAKLYLAGATLFDHPQIQRSLRPSLPRRARVDDALLALGIRPQAYRADDNIVLLRPREIGPPGTNRSGAESEVNSAAELNRLLAATAHPGALCYHEPERTRLTSFDAKSPFGQATTFTSLVSEFSPSGEENRRRFTHALATLDAEAIFDGGWLLPLGQEAALADLVSVYRQLPPDRFELLDESSQPVTIRYLAREEETFVYLANDSAWPASVTLEVTGPADAKIEKIGLATGVGALIRSDDTMRWTVNVPPCGIAAGRLVGRGVRLRSPKITLPERAAAALEARIRDLGARAASLSSPTPLAALANPGFELPADGDHIPGWTFQGAAGTSAELDKRNPHGGEHALALKSAGGLAELRSNVIDAPDTGRASVSLWLKAPDAARQPSVRLTLEAKADDVDYQRYATLGAGAAPLTEEWAQFLFQVDDLPTERVSDLRVRIDLVSAGAVMLDDLQIYDLAFAESERVELNKLITLASYKLQAGQVADCAHILEGYWPQFLLAHVAPYAKPQPMAQGRQSEQPVREAKKPGRLEQIKGYLPKWPSF